MNSTKRQKDMTPVDEFPRWEGVQYTTENSRGKLLIAKEIMKWLGQRENDAQLWIYLLVKVKSDAVNNNTT